ncbi:MAG: response regulator [Deltaproteobacteria bacterium]|nr:response regulator [Deltaproteobacteria bacterium]
MNLPHELFLLLLNLSQIKKREQIIKMFLEAMADIFQLADVKFVANPPYADGRVFPINTLSQVHGYIVCSSDISSRSNIEQALLRNAVSMLGVIIEKNEHDQLLSDEKLKLDELVRQRSQELLEKNIVLEKINAELEQEMAQRMIAERDLDMFFQLSPGLLCIAGLDGYLKKLNPAWTTTLGWTAEEMKAKPWLEFVHADDRDATIQAGETLMQGGVLLNFENRYRSKNGEYKWLSWSSFPKVDDGLIFAVVLDVTETKLLEEKLRQSEKLQAVGQLAGGIAHDFNNQLSGILGFADLLSEHLQQEPMLLEYTEQIINAAKRSADLTSQLLAFARKGTFHAVPIDLHELISEVITLLHHTIDRQIELVTDFADQPLWVKGSPSQLQNAILNLALNARDAMDQGQRRIRFSTKTVEINDIYRASNSIDLRDGVYSVVEVEDNGKGMSPDVLARALEPFYTTKEAGKGTGMGLSVVYGTIRHHKGDMVISSTLGQGTTVHLYLPLTEAANIESVHWEHNTHPAPDDRAASQKKNVLLVDDESMLRAMTAEMLIRMGYTVTSCQDGMEAVAYYTDHHDQVDAVILDMIMPKMDGSKTFRRLKEINPSVRVVLASGYSEDALANELITEGAAGFLQKPFRKQNLAEMMSQILA